MCTSTDDALLGGMNKFICYPEGNQFEFFLAGLVHALRDVAKGKTCYISYGEDHDWNGYKVFLAHELASILLACVYLFGHPSNGKPVEQILVDEGIVALQEDIPGSKLERLFMAVVNNRVPRELTHSIWSG